MKDYNNNHDEYLAKLPKAMQKKYTKIHNLIMQSDAHEWQAMIDDGSCWRMEGWYGRRAMEYLESGDCILGLVAGCDYYGNKIPTFNEVQKDTKGSLEYCERTLKASGVIIEKKTKKAVTDKEKKSIINT